MSFILLLSSIAPRFPLLAVDANSATNPIIQRMPHQNLEGTWIRPISGQEDRIEGLVFDSDRRFGLIGIHTMNGLGWNRENDELIVTTNTGRYPAPFESRLRIESLIDDRLTLAAEGNYLAGTYERNDGASGKVVGTVTYRERIALPPSAALHVTLNDVSRQDVAAVFIADQTIPTRGRQVPIPFRVYYSTADIEPRFTYSVRAEITVDGQRRFITDTVYPVITRDHPSEVEMVLVPIRASGLR